MEKILIYKYWMGPVEEREIIEKQVRKFNRHSEHFRMVICPTIEEHDYLFENNWYYREKFLEHDLVEVENIFKFWISSKKTNFIFIDSSIEFKEENLYKLFLRCRNENKNCFIFKSYRILYTGFFIIINATSIMHKCYVFYSNNNLLNSSITLTKFMKKEKKIRNCKIYDNKYALFYNIGFLNFNTNDYEVLKLNPALSINKKENHKYWSKKIKFFKMTNMRDYIFLNMPLFFQKMFLKIID